MSNEPQLNSTEDAYLVDAVNSVEADSAAYGDFTNIGAGMTDAIRHKLRLIAAYVASHPGG